MQSENSSMLVNVDATVSHDLTTRDEQNCGCRSHQSPIKYKNISQDQTPVDLRQLMEQRGLKYGKSGVAGEIRGREGKERLIHYDGTPKWLLTAVIGLEKLRREWISGYFSIVNISAPNITTCGG